MSRRYEAMFQRLAEQNAGAFIPFCILGDPDPYASLDHLRALVRGGADALELGIPFSDPVADGPTIQAAAVRALDAGFRVRDAWQVLTAFRVEYPDVPIGLLVYANLVEAPERDAFYQCAAAAGVDSVLIADVPTIEAGPYLDAAHKANIAPVMIATSNASESALKDIASMGRGYTYVISRRGVTGTEEAAGNEHLATLAKLAKLDAPPPVLGFGIAKPAQVRDALRAGARGAISGSAVVSIIAAHLDDPDLRCRQLEEFTRAMKAATVLCPS